MNSWRNARLNNKLKICFWMSVCDCGSFLWRLFFKTDSKKTFSGLISLACIT